MWKTASYLHQWRNNNGSGVNEWIVRLVIPIQFDEGHRFSTRLMTYILVYDLRPNLICHQSIINWHTARLDCEWNTDVSDGMTLSVDCAQRHAPVVWAITCQLRYVWGHLNRKSHKNCTDDKYYYSRHHKPLHIKYRHNLSIELKHLETFIFDRSYPDILIWLSYYYYYYGIYYYSCFSFSSTSRRPCNNWPYLGHVKHVNDDDDNDDDDGDNDDEPFHKINCQRLVTCDWHLFTLNSETFWSTKVTST